MFKPLKLWWKEKFPKKYLKDELSADLYELAHHICNGSADLRYGWISPKEILNNIQERFLRKGLTKEEINEEVDRATKERWGNFLPSEQ